MACAVGLIGAGCGDEGESADVPADAVATVGDTEIAKVAYDKMHPSTLAANPDPRLAEVAAMQILLQREWTEQEAAAEGVEVSDQEVRKALAEQRAQFFKTAQQYRAFLRRSKRSEADLYAGMKQKLLMDKLTARAVKEAPKVDDQRVATYYERNKAEFELPVRYAFHSMLTRTEAQANAAKRAIAGGMSWLQAMRTYSPRTPNPAQDSKQKVVNKTGVAEVDAAFAKAKAGDSVVLKTQYGWLLAQVDRILPARQRPFAEVKSEIKKRLVGSREQDAIDRYVQEFQDEYKAKSVCAEAYKVAECSNGPDENPKPKPPTEDRPSPDDSGEGADK